MTAVLTPLDRALGRYPMYRVVSVSLGVLAVIAFVLALTEDLSPFVFVPGSMLLTLVVLLGASVGSNLLLARVVRVRAHPDSAIITGLLLWFLFWPTDEPAMLAFLALAAVLANASKYVLRWHDRHLFNPAAMGVVLLGVIGWALGTPAQLPFTTWWIGSAVLLPWVVLAALVVLWRLRRAAHVLVFVVLATALIMWTQHDGGVAWGDGLSYALESTAMVFFAAFMLTEPLTLAPRRVHQLLAAVVAAIVFPLPAIMFALGYELDLAPIGGSSEILALVCANLVAVLCGQRGASLQVIGTRDLGGDMLEVELAGRRPLRFTPGQYLELDIASAGAPGDHRGMRRVLSISSPPGPSTTVAVRVPERPSAFKAGLRELEPGDRVRATVIGGDFTWPRGSAPLLLVAGGIGVTPFLSQVRAAGAQDRDVVLVYGCEADQVPYATELADTGVRVVLVSPSAPGDLPGGWTHVEAAFITREVIAEAVPDHAGRQAFVSGPPAMVNALRLVLPRARFDHFTGY